MREITTHKVNELNEAITITVMDEPGAGGASHVYAMDLGNDSTSPGARWIVEFQNGPIKEAGVNGLSHEALIVIIIDRLRSFQAGPFSSRENALALTKLEEAMHWLHHRTRDRMLRGVEGTTSL